MGILDPSLMMDILTLGSWRDAHIMPTQIPMFAQSFTVVNQDCRPWKQKWLIICDDSEDRYMRFNKYLSARDPLLVL
jgi:hypothetical protein